MKFYDVALAQGVHDKVLAYDFFRFVSGPQLSWPTQANFAASSVVSPSLTCQYQ
jgi:hypothetical protein